MWRRSLFSRFHSHNLLPSAANTSARWVPAPAPAPASPRLSSAAPFSSNSGAAGSPNQKVRRQDAEVSSRRTWKGNSQADVVPPKQNISWKRVPAKKSISSSSSPSFALVNEGVQAVDEVPKNDREPNEMRKPGRIISAEAKRKFIVNTLLGMRNSKEVVYDTLDAWVAWEQNFPLANLKRALVVLEKEEQWHRVVQVLKWMLSKGQGTTMGTYEQLIRALEKDNRPEEAHSIWMKKISYDLHSVPWRVCDLMISIYYRNNMLERLVKLFEGLEEYDRRPPCNSIPRKVADAYELLGLLEKKNRILDKYSSLFNQPPGESFKKPRKLSQKQHKKSGEKPKTTESTDHCMLYSGSSHTEAENVI